MVAIWRYTKFEVSYSFIKRGYSEVDDSNLKIIRVKRISPFATRKIDSSVFCGISEDSKTDTQIVLGKTIYHTIYNFGFIGELILYLTIIGLLGAGLYILYPTLIGGEALGICFILVFFGLMYNLYFTKYIDKLLFVIIPIKRGWIPLDHLRDEIENASNRIHTES